MRIRRASIVIAWALSGCQSAPPPPAITVENLAAPDGGAPDGGGPLLTVAAPSVQASGGTLTGYSFTLRNDSERSPSQADVVVQATWSDGSAEFIRHTLGGMSGGPLAPGAAATFHSTMTARTVDGASLGAVSFAAAYASFPGGGTAGTRLAKGGPS